MCPVQKIHIHCTFSVSISFIIVFCNHNFVFRGLTFLYLKNADSSQKYYTAVYRSRQESSKPGLSKVRTVLSWDGTSFPYRTSTQFICNEMYWIYWFRLILFPSKLQTFFIAVSILFKTVEVSLKSHIFCRISLYLWYFLGLVG